MRHTAGWTAAVMLIAAAAMLAPCPAIHAQPAHGPAGHHAEVAADSTNRGAARAAPDDRRIAVAFPAGMREHTLANMRDHLLALQEIQSALAGSRFDAAAEIAERRLGMSSLALHGAHDAARHMPAGMQEAGTAMHRSASRLSLVARDAAVSNDVRPALSALAEVTGTCVACHAGYRLSRVGGLYLA